MNKFVILIAFLCSSTFNFGQEDIQTEISQNSLSGNILGTGSYIGLSYERLIDNTFSAEIGIGLIGYGVGLSYYPFHAQVNKVCPFIGLKHTSHAIVDGEHKKVTYIPLGMTIFGKSGFNFSLDVGPAYRNHLSPGYMPTEEEINRYPFDDYGFFGNVKLGYRF